LLGDSLFANHDGWDKLDPGATVVNLGRGGDTAHAVLARLRDAAGHGPAVIFLQAGLNDLLQGVTPEAMVARHLALWRAAALLAPESRLIVSSLLPVNPAKYPSPMVRLSPSRVLDANGRLAAMARLYRVEYVDAHARLAGEDGNLPGHMTDDGLHLSAPGYRAWIDCLRPSLAAPAFL
jgi:lysophospholipase L1-like esterase